MNLEVKKVHEPVLLKEVLEYLNLKNGDIFVDGTVNGGGHTMAIWEKIKPDGKIIAIDKDLEIIKSLKERIGEKNIYPICSDYSDIKNIIDQKDFGKISGILLDLGYSSFHVDLSGRGFSFLKDEPLIMRYEANIDPERDLTAYEFINSFSEKDMADVIYKYGEERRSRKIAKEIVRRRRIKRIESSGELAEIISSVCFSSFSKIHPATKTFQAIRIFINDEFGSLKKILEDAYNILKPGGRFAIISFHSLEDRIVKSFFRENKDKYNILTKKPIVADREEIVKNKRARSAKLRVVEKKK